MHMLKYVWNDVAFEIAATDWQLDLGSLCSINQIRLKAVVLGCPPKNLRPDCTEAQALGAPPRQPAEKRHGLRARATTV